MSDAAITAIVSAVPPTLVALAGLIVAIRNGRKTDKVSRKADVAAVHAEVAAVKSEEVRADQQALKSQADQIEKNTDGKLTMILQKYEDEQKRSEELQAELDALYAVMSARIGKPVMRIKDIARREDFGEEPKTGNGSGAHPLRRKTDKEPE